jgi:hypothetical protein
VARGGAGPERPSAGLERSSACCYAPGQGGHHGRCMDLQTATEART